jgi:hypothetical protein
MHGSEGTIGRSPLRAVALWLALLVSALAAAAAPTAADAAGEANSGFRHPPGESAAFTLAGSNGYTLNFKSEGGMLAVVVSRGRPPAPTISADGRLLPPARSGAVATYEIPTGPDPRRIEADLGALGHLDLSFQPSGRREVNRVDLESKTEHCVGAARVVRRLGSFVGSVSFSGEDGYTSVEATSAPGSVGVSPFRNCSTLPGEEGKNRGHEPSAWMTVMDRAGVAFTAITGPDGALFSATAFSTPAPGVGAFRVAYARGPAGDFSLLDGGRRGASLRPSSPFSGSGTYRPGAGSGHGSFAGSLTVEFPGETLAVRGTPRLGVNGAQR